MDLSRYNPSQNHDELGVLLEVLDNHNIKNIVEIGVDRGYSLEVWHDFFKPALLIGIDPNDKALDPGAVEKSGAIIINKLSQDPEVFEYVKSLTRGFIDFLFIDGDHHYQPVKDDFEKYYPLVSEGGFVVFHDAVLKNHPDVEVEKFWHEIKDKYTTTTITLGGTGYGVIFK